jgi:CAAX protease family protein
MLSALFKGPAPYVPRSRWPAWAVLPAGVLIFVLAVVLGGLLTYADIRLTGAGVPHPIDPSHPPPQATLELATWIAGLQIGLIAFTLLAAGFFSSKRAEVLSLRAPAPGWAVLPLALIPLFVGGGLWTGLLLLWKPTTVLQDLRPFQMLLNGHARALVLLIICVGAPLSEELLFRGFLFSGLAKTRLGFVGTALITTLLWTGLHWGYSLFGLFEVLSIGLYLSWLLVRTGSLWATIFCHAAYNTVVAVVLLFIALPGPG